MGEDIVKKCREGSECEQIACLIHEYLDKEIDDEVCRRIQTHLATCTACFGRFTFEQGLRGAVRKCVCSSNILPQDLRSRICNALENEA